MALSEADKKTLGKYYDSSFDTDNVSNVDQYFDAKAAASGAGGEKTFNQIQAASRTFDDEGNVTGYQESYKGPQTFTDIYNLTATNTSGVGGIKTVTTGTDGNLIYPDEIVQNNHIDMVLKTAANDLIGGRNPTKYDGTAALYVPSLGKTIRVLDGYQDVILAADAEGKLEDYKVKEEKVITIEDIKKANEDIIKSNQEEIDTINLEESSNSDVAKIGGTATNVTQEDYDAGQQAIQDQIAVGSPSVVLDTPTPVYSQQPVASTETYQPVTTNQTGATTTTYPMSNVSGTQQVPLQTAGMSAVPQQVTVRPNYTGTTMQNVSSMSQKGFGGQKVYINKFGQQVTVSVDGMGNPLTYIPPGFKLAVMDASGNYSYPKDTVAASDDATVTDGVTGASQGGLTGYALGGDVQGQLRLANKFLGYTGEATQESLNLFLNSNPGAAAKMGKYQQAMSNMAQPIQKMYQGGTVQGFSNSGDVVANTVNPPLGFQPGSSIVNDGNKFKIKNPDGTFSQVYDNAIDVNTAFEQANRKLGLPNYGEYLTQQGIDTNLPGFDNEMVHANYMSYLANPANVKKADTVATKDYRPDTFTGDKFSYTDTVVPMFAGAVQQTMQPTQAPVSYIQPMAADMIGQTAGQTSPIAPMAEAGTVANVTQSQMPQVSAAGQMTDVKKAQTGVATEVAKLSAQTGDKPADITDEQQTTSAVSDLDAATGQIQQFDPITGIPLLHDPDKELFKPATNEYKRTLTQDPVTGEFTELISGVANAQTAANFTEQIQASTASPTAKATVAGQLNILMKDFEGGNTPAWAAGSMRAATAAMIERGLGASSMAGQAIIQAAMESALPIAMADAQTTASFEAQNLSNKQQVQMLRAQQRATFMGQEFDQAFQARVQNAAKVSEIANMNFTADQTIQLENSRNAQSLSMANLTNSQAMVMAEAAALAGLDTQNLNNRQQAAVQNAQNFLAMDMANLTNEQQTAMFKTQQNVQALFTDQAAENASKQFNASSTNQTNQFFANLSTQTSQFNAAQTNAMDQFNVNAVNGLREFNSNIQQQRDMFNAQNGLVIAQANAQWRQNLTTINNATQNASNMDFAQTINGMTSKNIDEVWQRERDIMSLAFKTAESNASNATSIIVQQMAANAQITAAELQAKIKATERTGNFLSEVFLKIVGNEIKGAG